MLLRGLTWLIFFQLVGTGLNVLFLPFLPGPIIGMVLLVVTLCLRQGVSESLDLAATGLLKYLPLILVPPAVGIMAYGAEIVADAAAILITLTVSFVLSVPFCGWLMQRLIRRQQSSEGDN
ncbi:MAG TPA: CidA/LrgA family protein [Pseudomonas xinjiangensis]|uniref:CidA/LrgA family protein n=2 Tax=root TaxID=1 RepID=A0A7V1BPB9_9GAMM|nr:CidA/LrgA family protein [Halopseudomonas xinjiangensis]HEC47336.1 CidA/LrgA family protein [Halopseudomonas xinjiangensis]